jgi:HEAT repeat protein
MRNVDDYLNLARAGHGEAAGHGLIALGEPALPQLESAYRQENDPAIRNLIVRAIWEIRSPASIDFLAEALQDPAPEVWRQALDGLVALASRESLSILESARDRLGDDRGPFHEWVAEAIEDVRGRINE